MFVVPQHQKHQNTETIGQTAQNELDKAMVEVLQRNDIDVYEKATKYSSIQPRECDIHRETPPPT